MVVNGECKLKVNGIHLLVSDNGSLNGPKMMVESYDAQQNHQMLMVIEQ